MKFTFILESGGENSKALELAMKIDKIIKKEKLECYENGDNEKTGVYVRRYQPPTKSDLKNSDQN